MVTKVLNPDDLQLPAELRSELWTALIQMVEEYAARVHTLPVAPPLDATAIRNLLKEYDFDSPIEPVRALEMAASSLTKWQVHTPHPRYFGLFNPAPTTMGIAADALVAAFNPQIAAWSHNPFAAEVELHLLRAFGAKFGFAVRDVDGTFCSGGMEANHTALLCALSRKFPDFGAHGLRALPQSPILYVSSESHHSFLKSARLCGLGTAAVRVIAADSRYQMRADLLADAIAADRASGSAPFLIVATAGTTSAGAIDPLPALAKIASADDLWLHTDAAWGGAAALVPELRPALAGLELSDSITFDAHKWLSVPMGAGLFLTRRSGVLDATFRVPTAYMPKDAADLDIVDPHLHSMQWSRRFIGLKVFLSLLVAGWRGYEEAIRRQTAMGALLRSHLVAAHWTVVNDTPLPVVCFRDPQGDAEHQRSIAAAVVQSGDAWISPTVIGGETVIRACVTHYATTTRDVDALVAALGRARAL